jgi:N6-adenosine-specific RNA methylase IME4
MKLNAFTADLFGDEPSSRKPGRPPSEKTAPPPAEREPARRLVVAEAKIKQVAKRAAREARERQLADRTIAASKALDRKVYGVIYADPPWRFEPWSRDTGMDRAPENHYPTMPVDEIKALQIPAAPHCVLFLWATVPMLLEALDVLAAWGFKYKSALFWVKPQIGLGYWTRNRVEILLIGTRGNVPAPPPGDQPDQVVSAPTGRHSVKPELFAQVIERLYPHVPKLEMFARVTRAGWDAWGNETGALSESAADGALLSESELEQDAIESYYVGIAEIGKRVRAGEPVPAFLLPKRSEGAR